MTDQQRTGLRPTPALLRRSSLLAMGRLARALHGLSRHAGYVALALPHCPPVVGHDPGHDALPMGYDFHDTPEGPRLIEVNTNAGGLLLAWLAQHPQGWRDWNTPVPDDLARQWAASPLARYFRQEQQRAMPGQPLRQVVILDQAPREQFLYPEMAAYAALFRAMGLTAQVCGPESLEMDERGVFHAGQAVQLVYNRHCDFYLEQPELAGLRAAWLAGRVCLTPNPRAYGLLADKRRMVLWRERAALREAGVAETICDRLQIMIPPCRMLADMDRDALWQNRKNWVLKPVTSFGSRGVVLGESMSRVRFAALEATTTLVQSRIPPSLVQDGAESLKCDWRLFTYQDKIITVAARLYKGQVTNLRTPGSGFAPVVMANAAH